MKLPDTVSAASLNVGDKLPEWTLNVTSTVIVAGAIATRDFMPVHHDRDYAQSQGAPDVFMNILSTNGYISRYVSDWAGPNALQKKIAIRLGAPCIPGKPLTFSGEVTAIESAGDHMQVDIAVTAANELGNHASGTVSVLLPA